MSKSVDSIPKMPFKRKDKIVSSIFVTTINVQFIIGVYQGSISPYDILKNLEFLNFLLRIWNNIKPIKTEEERTRILNLEHLLDIAPKEFKKYEELGKMGEYSIKFLIILARLLMLQEKTNLETAYMFKKLLEGLKEGEDIFKIVSIATHRGNK